MIKGRVVFQCAKDLLIQRVDLGTYSVFSRSQCADPVKTGDLVWLRDQSDDPWIATVQSVDKEFKRFISMNSITYK